MKWLFLGCFPGRGKTAASSGRRSAQPFAATSPPQQDTVIASSTETAQSQPEQAAEDRGSSEQTSEPESRSDACGTAGGRDVDASGNQPEGRAAERHCGIASTPAEQREVLAPRLSLDCGVGMGLSPPARPEARPPPNLSLSFTRLPAPNLPLALMVRASVDTASADSFAASEGSSGAPTVRGGAGAASLATSPGDLALVGSRHLVSRALRGRASLDALLMLGALVRAADEAGLAVTAIGGTPRLERIESGDLPPGEDGHADRQTPSRPSRQKGAAATAAAAHAAAAVVGPRPEWCADAQTAAGPRLAQRPQRPRVVRRTQNALPGSSSSGTAAAAAATLAIISSCGIDATASTAIRAGAGGSAAGFLSPVPACGALDPSSHTEFSFSRLTVTGSLRRSSEISRGQYSDLIVGHSPHALAQCGGQVADSNQVLELLMRLVTNCSTANDNDVPSTSSGGADRSSAGTVPGASTAGIGYGSRAVTGTGAASLAGAGSGYVGPVVAPLHPRPVVQRSASERHRYLSARRWPGADGGGGSSGGPPHVSTAGAAAAPGTEEGDSSAPLLKLHHQRNLMLAGGSAGGRTHRSIAAASAARRNSWDTLGGSAGSAVAVAAAAAAALAAAGLLRGSTSSRIAGGAGAGCCSNSGKTATGSATRFWPMGGVLQEDSGPASLLLVGALSGGMSVGTTSATSLLQLPAGSGSVRDVLSRMHQQQLHQEGPHAATSSGSWSGHTGLASLFDTHLTAALRCAGAVRTFKRALGGPAAFSHASSAISQHTGNLGRQDTSLSLTSGLMVLNFGSTAGSSGPAGAGSGGAGVSQLGAATAATAAAAAAGLLVNSLTPPHVRQATISSISTIHSNPEAVTAGGSSGLGLWLGGGNGAAAVTGSDNDGDDDIRPQVKGASFTAAGCRGPRSSRGGASEPQASRVVVQRELRAFVERQHPQHPGTAPARYFDPNAHHHYHPEQHSQQLQPRLQGPNPQASFGGASPHVSPARKPSASGLPPGYEERGSLSLALGLAAGVHGGAGSIVVHASGANTLAAGPPTTAPPGGVAAASPAAAAGGAPGSASPPTEVAAARSLAAGSLAAGPVGAAWLQAQAPGGGAPGRGHPGGELSASSDFSRYSSEKGWGPPGGGLSRGPDTFTFTGAGSYSFSNGRTESAALLDG